MTATNPAKIQLDTKEEILKPDTKLIKDLIAESREKGFITLDDINNHLGDDPVSSEQMEQIFSVFSEMEIDVVDSDKKENLNKYLSTNYKLSNSLKISYDQTTNKLIYVVYEKKNNLESLFEKKDITFKSINYFTAIYEYLTPLNKDDGISIYINLRVNLFDIILSQQIVLFIIFFNLLKYFSYLVFLQ